MLRGFSSSSLRSLWRPLCPQPSLTFLANRKFSKEEDASLGFSPYQNETPFVPPERCPKRGIQILHDPWYNQGTSFTLSQRDRLGIRGLLPPRVSNMQEQMYRIQKRLDGEPDDVKKYVLLNSLQDRNEILFYSLLQSNIKKYAPLIYTPTVGIACQRFGQLYRRPRGLFLSIRDKGELGSIVYNWPRDDVDIIVVTDGSRILGLGDLGCNGMGIPIGKLALYSAVAGIDPSKTLPIMLDLGTNNQSLLDDPTYVGLKQKRVTGGEYYAFLEEFMWAVKNRWPNVLVQFEDFESTHAYPLLHRYRKKQLCFNDDIQGTGAVALAGVLAALKLKGLSPAALKEQRIVCLGAGSAGLGVCYSLWHALIGEGLSQKEASERFWLVDLEGLVTTSRKRIPPGLDTFARTDEASQLTLLDVVKKVKPTILLGLSGCGQTFTQEIIQSMAEQIERPIIFPLSNPTKNAECTAQQAYEWTNGRAIFSSGSPFQPVVFNDKTYYPSQGNNFYIFPGVGLGAITCGAKRISLTMFSAAAKALAECVGATEIEKGLVYPDPSDIFEVSVKVASAVVEVAMRQNLATKFPPTYVDHHGSTSTPVEEWVRSHTWSPTYRQLIMDE